MPENQCFFNWSFGAGQYASQASGEEGREGGREGGREEVRGGNSKNMWSVCWLKLLSALSPKSTLPLSLPPSLPPSLFPSLGILMKGTVSLGPLRVEGAVFGAILKVRREGG